MDSCHHNARIVRIPAGEAIRELRIYIGKALERTIPVITFGDPDEKILFKEQALTHDGVFCSQMFWEMVFGDAKMDARFCVTNKRLLFYRVNQISGISGDGLSINYAVTPPSFRWLWLPLSGITSVSKEKRGLVHITCLNVRNCVPTGGAGHSSVIPGINCRDGLKYDPAYVNFAGSAGVLDFDHLAFLNKRERQEVFGILKGLLPDIELPKI